jgi:hypothetical protein
MSRIYGDEVLTILKGHLTDNLNVKLTEILTNKEDLDCPLVKKVNIGYSERQYPECLITLNDSEVDIDTLDMDIDQTPERYPVDIVIVLKDNTAKTYLRQEYYIKALQQILHGYSDPSVTWIVVTGSIRANMYTEQKETLRVVGVSIIVRTL